MKEDTPIAEPEPHSCTRCVLPIQPGQHLFFVVEATPLLRSPGNCKNSVSQGRDSFSSNSASNEIAEDNWTKSRLVLRGGEILEEQASIFFGQSHD